MAGLQRADLWIFCFLFFLSINQQVKRSGMNDDPSLLDLLFCYTSEQVEFVAGWQLDARGID